MHMSPKSLPMSLGTTGVLLLCVWPKQAERKVHRQRAQAAYMQGLCAARAERTEPLAPRRCAKSFRIEVLNELERQELILIHRGNKPFSLTEAGEEEAQRLLDKYGIDPDTAS